MTYSMALSFFWIRVFIALFSCLTYVLAWGAAANSDKPEYLAKSPSTGHELRTQSRVFMSLARISFVLLIISCCLPDTTVVAW